MNSQFNLLNTTPEIAAKRLLGCYIVRSIEEDKVICKIVETEAYDQNDPASHSFRGPTPRTQVMFGPAGFAYVYFTYGMHHCLNIVVGPKGHGSAVLIRALEPISGLDLIKANRQNVMKDTMLTNGPGKVCQALAIGREYSGHNLANKPLELEIRPAIKDNQIISSTRIGITKATDKLWRFYIKDNPYVSRYS